MAANHKAIIGPKPMPILLLPNDWETKSSINSTNPSSTSQSTTVVLTVPRPVAINQVSSFLKVH